MRRAWRAALATAIVLSLTVAIPAAQAGTNKTFRDEFNAISFTGNDGTDNWTNGWQELPFPDGPTSGNMRVVNASQCASTNCFRMGVDEGSISLRSIWRQADLTGATRATLTFSYRRTLLDDEGGSVSVEVSDNGSTWATLATYDLDGSDGGQVSQNFDITAWIDNDTRIRFAGSGDDVESYFYADNVQISGEFNNDPTFDQNIAAQVDAESTDVTLPSPATDPDGDDLTYSAANLPPGLAIDPDTGTIAGTIGYNAASGSPYSVIVTVDDGFGGTDEDTFQWVVTDVNRDPVLDPINDVTIDESSPWSITATASDPDLPDDTLTWSLASEPVGMTIDPDSGVISWTPTETQGPSVQSVKVTVADGASAKDSQWVDIIVEEVNSAPSISAIADKANGVGDSISIPLSATDGDVPANTLSFSGTGLPDGLVVSGSTITGTITSAAPASSPFSVQVTVTDDGSPTQSDSTSFTWVVTSTNQAPVLAFIPDQNPPSGGDVSFTATATDPDGDDLTFSLESGGTAVPSGASIDPDSGVFVWSPTDPQRDATYSIKVKVTDDGTPSLSDSQTVVTTVPDINHAPVLSPLADRSTAEGDPVAETIDADDEDGDTLTFSAAGLPPGVSLNTSSGTLTGAPTFDAAADSPYAVTVTVRDNGSPVLADTDSFVWTITNTNRAPEAQDMEIAILAGDTATITLAGSDADDDPLTFEVDATPGLGDLAGTPPLLTYTAGPGEGDDSFTFIVSDGDLESVGTVVVSIRTENDPPVAKDDSYEVADIGVLDVRKPGVLTNDTDHNGDDLTAAIASKAGHGDVTLNDDGSFTYVADDGFTGTDKFEYDVSDGIETDRATVTLTVSTSPPPPAPVEPPKPIVENTRADVVSVIAVAASTAAANQVDPVAVSGTLSRTFVTMARAGSRQVSVLGLPFGLLVMLGLVAATLGRLSSLPLFSSRRRHGIIDYYDSESGFGTIIGDDGHEVFVDASVAKAPWTLQKGVAVRYRAIKAKPRHLATVVAVTD